MFLCTHVYTYVKRLAEYLHICAVYVTTEHLWYVYMFICYKISEEHKEIAPGRRKTQMCVSVCVSPLIYQTTGSYVHL